ncbi:LytR/AlgR family response regulator transcription factor [Flagellimonas flava]|uniref:LytTr DNA-binding domain-containing protein n=1 Tax=Flagellimonas flava TaxID=570519 RepID=A0A1M5KK41_9FLAO|nr:LytTR family DNA-binding domain-containing protein [Allomuricauda flava]SHG53040.1 LytTr DNA-binding domain-containing protein [Allomuricauda flava]
MGDTTFSFKKANRFLPHILLVGIGIGTANYITNDGLNWIQWCVQSLSTSLLIGYSLVAIGVNKSWLKSRIDPTWKLYTVLILFFFFVGVLATEIEHSIRSLVFGNETFQPFSSGKMYGFNGIISLILGFSFFRYDFFFRNKSSLDQDSDATKNETAKEPITSVPAKQGQNILLIPIAEIVYFEAYDNYSFVYDTKGKKRLCDYSLLFLEKRLGNDFSRVHRKYIVNSSHIQQIKPHLNGRYLIVFASAQLEPISTSKSHASTIRKLIKLE